MRKITAAATAAFFDCRPFNSGNTAVAINKGRAELRLHGNLIAIYNGTALSTTLAGWPTRTTMDRLNGIYSEVISRRLIADHVVAHAGYCTRRGTPTYIGLDGHERSVHPDEWTTLPIRARSAA